MKCNVCGATWQDVSQYSCPECGCAVDIAEEEDSYAQGVEAEKQGKYKTATAHYSLAADLGNPLAAYSVCRAMEKSGQKQKDVRLYEFWLSYAAESDMIAAWAYAKYLRKKGEEPKALYYYIQAANQGHEASILRLGKYYLTHGNRPAARYYFDKAKGLGAKVMRLITLKKAASYPPAPPEMPDDTVEVFSTGEYALSLGLPHIAFTYFERAAEAAYVPAIRRVVDMCMQGRGTKRDEDKVIRYLTELGEAGDMNAYIRLGEYFESGLIGEGPDSRVAFQKYMLAAQGGDLDGMLLVGDFYHDGNGIEKNTQEALLWYERCAQAGSKTAADRIGQIKRKAELVIEQGLLALAANEGTKAFHSFSCAVEMGNIPALVYLGDCYMTGKGVERNIKTAARYYEEAAERGNAFGKYRLGVLYMNNLGVKFSAKKARMYLLDALNGGISKAQQALETLHKRKQAYLAQKVYSVSCTIYHRGDTAQAAKFRHVATKMGHARAGYLLGCMYDCGDGVAKDQLRAEALHEQARRRGFDGRALGWWGKYLHHIPRP